MIFVVIIKKLVSVNESAVTFLQGTIEKIKMTDYEGDNVRRAVSHNLSAYKPLKAVNKVPGKVSKAPIKDQFLSSMNSFPIFCEMLR